MDQDLTADFVQSLKNFVPGVSLDCVVFGYSKSKLHVILLKYRNTDVWALPGGFLPKDVEMEAAVHDVLYRRTGLQNIFLTQYHTFSSLNRGWDCNPQSRDTLREVEYLWPQAHRDELRSWFDQRFISTAYLALIQSDLASLVPDELSACCEWIPVTDLPELVLDHGRMIEMALEHLKIQMNYLPIGKSLLPDRFTMSDLQSVYESILRKKLDRGNFQRKMLKLGILKRHEKLMTGAANKAPFLYSIDEAVYRRLLQDGIGFSIG